MDWMSENPGKVGCGLPNFTKKSLNWDTQRPLPKPESKYCTGKISCIYIALTYIEDQIQPAEDHNSSGQQLGGNAFFG